MQIKRDYSQPFFGTNSRRRRRHTGRWVLAAGLLVGALVLFVMTRFDELQSAAMDAMGLAPTATPFPSDFATEGARYHLAWNLPAAAEMYERALALRPDDVDYLYDYGQVLVDMEDYERALEVADQITTVAPRDVRGYALRASAMVWSDNPAGAVPVGRAGLEIDRNFAPLYPILARAYAGVGDWSAAYDHAEQGVQRDPSSYVAHRAFAFVLASIGETDQAIDELEYTISLNPSYIPAYFELAGQFLALDLDEEAIAIYDRILSIDARNAKAHLRLCEAYSKVGQFERAIGFCEDAVTHDPTYVDAHFQLGMMRYTRREFAAAQQSFQQCVNYDESRVGCAYRLGLTYFYLGDCDTSWDMLENSLIMAQTQSGTSADTIANIRQGLTEVANQCGFTLPPFPTPEADEAGG